MISSDVPLQINGERMDLLERRKDYIKEQTYRWTKHFKSLLNQTVQRETTRYIVFLYIPYGHQVVASSNDRKQYHFGKTKRLSGPDNFPAEAPKGDRDRVT